MQKQRLTEFILFLQGHPVRGAELGRLSLYGAEDTNCFWLPYHGPRWCGGEELFSDNYAPLHLSGVRGSLVFSPSRALSLCPSQALTSTLTPRYAFSAISSLPKSAVSSVFLWS